MLLQQARASGDYKPGNDQWMIGISSILAHAMAIAPFKDNFWTTTTQPGNPYGWHFICKPERQYMLTCKVSKYCLLVLHISI